ncbi:probable E3 ubiquitin-protein ligase MARCHF10 [Spea bombifrons]|uniref:probable E3 ubiquitin-protein ligase MARCHF10 n=1 Tax=Spea bombifrons TaxID=233779 RepID=UPI002349D0A7|nr:probable E3 ubiquitin-protein ligase MARCHF10 [Spea bombifrons]
MAANWDRRASIVNRHHMRDMQNRIDMEYEAYLRRQEREREQAERERQHLAASQKTHHLNSMHSARSYKKPWQAGMATQKQFSGPSAEERRQDREPQAKSNQSRFPAINKSREAVRMKTSASQTTKPKTQKAAAVQPRIVVQQKRLHTRKLQANLSAVDRETAQARAGKQTIWPSDTFSAHRLKPPDNKNMRRFKEPEKRSKQQNIVMATQSSRLDQETFTMHDPTNKPAPSPILIQLQDDTSASSHAYPITSDSRDSPLMFFSDSLNDLQDDHFEEFPDNYYGETFEGYMRREASPDVSVCNSGREGRSQRTEISYESFEESEDHRGTLSQRTRPNTRETHVVESYSIGSEDGYSSDNESESQTSIQFQDLNEEDFLNFRDVTPVRSRRRPRRLLSPTLSSGSQEFVGDSHHNSPETSHNLSEASYMQRFNVIQAPLENNIDSPDGGLERVLPPLSNVMLADIGEDCEDYDLLCQDSTMSQEAMEQSLVSSGPSTLPSFATSALSPSPSVPDIRMLSENLGLVYLTLSMRRQPGDQNAGRILATDETKKPEADPEKLRKLQESLLQEDSDEEGDICRICLMGGDAPENHLIAPCRCTGSLEYVHQECMKKWLLAKITSGADLDAVRTCEMCKQKVQPEIDGFNLNEHYRKHQETQEQNPRYPSLYLMLLLHLYHQRYEELLRLSNTQDQVTEISRRISHLRSQRSENNTQDSP